MDHTRGGLKFDASFSSHIYIGRVVLFGPASLLNDTSYDYKIASWSHSHQFRGTSKSVIKWLYSSDTIDHSVNLSSWILQNFIYTGRKIR